MPRSLRKRFFRPALESLEDRLTPANPSLVGTVTLPGANSVWNFLIPQEASPVIADVDGDGRSDVLVPGGDGHLYAYDVGPGTAITLVHTYSLGQFRAPIHSTPVVVDLPRSLAASGKGVFAVAENGAVFGWDGQSGGVLAGWPQSVDFPPHPRTPLPPQIQLTSVAAIASGDLDRDGFPELVVTSLNNEVTAFRTRDASVFWRFSNDDTVFSSAAIGDLDRDGLPEVVVGGDSSASGTYAAGGRINCLSWDGRRKWVKATAQTIQSSPVLVDLTGNGNLNVVVGTGFNYPIPAGNLVFALDPQGNDLPGWPYTTTGGNVEGRPYSSPAIADLDSDGRLDVVISDGGQRIHAIESDGTALRPGAWPIQAFQFTTGQELYSSPIVADVDGDNQPDVVLASGSLVRAFDRTGTQIWEFRDNLPHFTAPAVGQLRGDGSSQLVFIANGFNGQLLSPSQLSVFDLSTTTLRPHWPQFRQNGNNNVVARPDGFSTTLIAQLYSQALGRPVSQAELNNIWLPQLRSASSLRPIIEGIVASQEARARAVTGFYQLYLGRDPETAGLNNWLTVLASGQTYASVQANIVGSLEAFQRAGNTNQLWVTYLYNKVLGRTPQNGEDQGWVSGLNTGRATRAQVAFGFLGSREYTEKTVREWYRTYGLIGPQEDSLQAAGWDLRRGRSEEQVLIDILTTNGGYIDAQFEASWVRALYADVLQRQAGPAETANWLRSLEGGAALSGVARAIQTSHEANQAVVVGFYQLLLRRTPTSQEIAGFVGQVDAGTRYVEILRALLQSQEYFDLAGRNTTTYIGNVYQNLLDRPVQQSELNTWNNFIAQGQNIRILLPNTLLASPEYLRHFIDLQFFKYLRRYPDSELDNSRLVRRGVPYGAQGLLNALQSGTDQRDIVTVILSAPEYVSLARYKAFYLGTGRWMDANLP